MNYFTGPHKFTRCGPDGNAADPKFRRNSNLRRPHFASVRRLATPGIAFPICRWLHVRPNQYRHDWFLTGSRREAVKLVNWISIFGTTFFPKANASFQEMHREAVYRLEVCSKESKLPCSYRFTCSQVWIDDILLANVSATSRRRYQLAFAGILDKKHRSGHAPVLSVSENAV